MNVAASDASGVTGTGTITIERRSDGHLSLCAGPTAAITSSATTRSGGWLSARAGGWRMAATRSSRPGGQYHGAQPPERHAGGVGVRRLRPRVPLSRAARCDTRGRSELRLPGRPDRPMFDSIRGSSRAVQLRRRGTAGAHDVRLRRDPEPPYDLRSRVTAEVLAVPGQVLFDIGFEHDLANRLVRTVDRAAQEVLIEHVITDGQLVQTRYGNGLERDYSYDPAGLLVASETRDAPNEVIESTRDQPGPARPIPLRLQVQGHHDHASPFDRRAILARLRREAHRPRQARLRLDPGLR